MTKTTSALYTLEIKDRLDDQLERRLNHAVFYSRDTERALLLAGSMPFRVERNDLISSWPERTDGRADA